MTTYLFSVEPEGFKELTLPQGQSFARHNCLRWTGDSKLDNWSNPELVWLQDDFSQPTDKDGDFLKMSGAVVLSQKAKQVLGNKLKDYVEFLPVTVDGETRYILNVVNVIDVLDREKSIYKIYSDGKVGMCEHGYLKEPLDNQLIFKVAGFLGRVFITDSLKACIETEQLTGALIREYKNP